MILLESVQALERQRHQLMFQQQQIALSLQQAKDTQFMQQQLQQMKLQRKPAVIKLALRKRLVAEEGTSPPLLSLSSVLPLSLSLSFSLCCYFMHSTHRTEQNQLKDIKFDFVPGQGWVVLSMECYCGQSHSKLSCGLESGRVGMWLGRGRGIECGQAAN